jgi:hypothetical protein
MKQIVNGIRYDTEKATRIADDRFWDGHNFERYGRNKYLYKSKNGRFFELFETCHQGEVDHIMPLSIEEAKILYEELREHYVEWEDAFGEEPEEA